MNRPSPPRRSPSAAASRRLKPLRRQRPNPPRRAKPAEEAKPAEAARPIDKEGLRALCREKSRELGSSARVLAVLGGPIDLVDAATYGEKAAQIRALKPEAAAKGV